MMHKILFLEKHTCGGEMRYTLNGLVTHMIYDFSLCLCLGGAKVIMYNSSLFENACHHKKGGKC